MIILFEENETLFQSLGLGVLSDTKACVVKETLNDSFELELQYPITGINFSKIKLDRIILSKSNPYSEAQPFRIYSISKPIHGIITVKAFHISYDMNGIVVGPVSGGTPGSVLEKIQNGALIKHSFKFNTDITDSKSFKTSNYYNMRAVLMGSDESFLSVYKGEIIFNKFNVTILKRRGSNKGASVRYAKNMTDLTHEVNYERLYNGVYPFYHKEETSATTETTSDGFKEVYIVGTKPYQDGWFSYTAGGEAYHPVDESPVQVASEGDYKGKVFVWNTTTQRYIEKIYNEMVNLIEYVTDVLTPSEKPSWIYIDVSSLPSIIVKANVDGYFKLATDNDWSKKSKGEIVFQGSILNTGDALIMYYSEVIPSSETSVESESTTVTHVELDDKIMWLETDAAKNMKYNRVLCLDLTSEFDDVPDKEKLEAKAKEYIEENKIGQYKYDTKVSFIDLASTTEGTVYDKMETVELGDTVRVVYEDLDVDVELRVISTTYNALTDKYEDIELGEKPEKISASSVQTGDNVSSLTNDVGYADTTTVNKLIAKIITADLIQAKNAKLSKAMVEELQSARIKCTGLIEATQFELDTLVAKMLTAENAVIKQTLEAGTVKVKGDITVTKGSISIENTESGTVFNVDRDGNVTANSVNITGGELNINDTFTVTPEGILTALGADIQGRIEADSGLIANFTIESADTVDGNSNRLYSGVPGQASSVLVSPGYNITITSLDNKEETRDKHNWAFLAGNQFGVDDQGNLYANSAIISGTIKAKVGEIGDFIINSHGLVNDEENPYVKIYPTEFVYGQHEEFKLTSTGTLKIQNANPFNISKWSTVLAVAYEQTVKYYPGDLCISTGELYVCKEETLGTPSNPQPFNIIYWTKLTANAYDEHAFYNVGDYCYYDNAFYVCTSPVGYQYITLDSTGLTASSIFVENANIHLGHIGGFTIGENALYKDIDSFDVEGSVSGVYLGPDGLRIGKNLKIFPDGRIMSGSRNYDESVIYHEGNYCIQQGSLFKCKVKATTGGTFNKDDWEEVSMRSLGVDDTGKLTATEAEIIGNITAKSGYIGEPGEGFTITSKAIYNGFDNPDSSATDEGVYLGTDGIRLGKKVTQQKVVTFGNLTANNSIIKSIEDIIIEVATYQDLQNYDTSTVELGQVIKVLSDSTHSNNASYYMWSKVNNVDQWVYNGSDYSKTNYIGSEFILSYDSYPEDRYIRVTEQDDSSEIPANKYEQEDNPNSYLFECISRTINNSTVFELDTNNFTFLNFNNNILWNLDGNFNPSELGNNGQIYLYFDEIDLDDNIYPLKLRMFYYDSEEDWRNDTNEHQFINDIRVLTNPTPITINPTYSPWIKIMLIKDPNSSINVDRLSNCSLKNKIDKLVLLPANSKSKSFVATKYNYIKLKSISKLGSSLDVSNIKLTLKVLPGFYVTPDGMMNAYNAKIWGSFIGDVNITGGAIRITNGSDKTFEVTSTGELSANSANITGTITATYITANNGGEIAGFTIDGNSIRKGDLGQNGSVWMCSGSETYADIGGSGSIKGWAFTAGNKFGITNQGSMYASSGKIASLIIDGNSLKYDDVFSINPTQIYDPIYPGDTNLKSSSIYTERLNVMFSRDSTLGSYFSFVPNGLEEHQVTSGGIHAKSWSINKYNIKRMIIYDQQIGSGVMELVTYQIDDDNNWTHDFGAGYTVISAIACFYRKEAGTALPSSELHVRWEGSQVWVHSGATGNQRSISVWVLVNSPNLGT